MYNKTLLSLLAVGIAAITPSNSRATDYIYNATVSLGVANQPGLGFGETLFSSPPTFFLNIGDTISGTITFAEPVTITAAGSGDSSISVDLVGTVSGQNVNLQSTETCSLLGVNPDYNDGEATDGSFGSTSITNLTSSSTGETGMEVGVFPSLHSPLTFTGMSYSFTLDQVSGATAPLSETPSNINIVAVGSTVVVDAPEPSSTALTLGGVALLALLGFRTRRLV